MFMRITHKVILEFEHIVCSPDVLDLPWFITKAIAKAQEPARCSTITITVIVVVLYMYVHIHIYVHIHTCM